MIGKRAEQIASNSPIYVEVDLRTNPPPTPLEIAEKELMENKIPFIVRRHLPNGEF